MKIGIWNIDHPEVGTSSVRKQQRHDSIIQYLSENICDLYILSEANSAMNIDGCFSFYSAESPFLKKSRSYQSPNIYRQVAIYSRQEMYKKEIEEPINGVLCQTKTSGLIERVYGNVITIKDQWKKDSSFKYSDRLNQQIELVSGLVCSKTLIAGDFNMKKGWVQKAGAHKKMEEAVERLGWVWPTINQTDSVQHVLHSPDLKVSLGLDLGVRESGLSDHPFMTVNVSSG